MEKIAIITGAARGIGEGIARRLALEGKRVALFDIDIDEAAKVACDITDRGGIASAFSCNVTSDSSVEQAVKSVSVQMGDAEILINNAGFARDGAFEAMSIDDWDSVHAVHLRGTFLMTKAVVGTMKQKGWGRIVNISSISAQGHAERANYCAAKAGIEGFTRSLAVELGPFGITINAVAPGLIVTNMTSATAARRNLPVEEHIKRAAMAIPVRRAGTPEDIAHAVSYFSGEHSGFVTGQTITVSGGVIV